MRTPPGPRGSQTRISRLAHQALHHSTMSERLRVGMLGLTSGVIRRRSRDRHRRAIPAPRCATTSDRRPADGWRHDLPPSIAAPASPKGPPKAPRPTAPTGRIAAQPGWSGARKRRSRQCRASTGPDLRSPVSSAGRCPWSTSSGDTAASPARPAKPSRDRQPRERRGTDPPPCDDRSASTPAASSAAVGAAFAIEPRPGSGRPDGRPH